jgi:beta-fructofuranosidase
MIATTHLDDALRARLAADPHRPRYHFQPPAQWMNDPNGLIQWRGRYHLFYQHHPFGPLWANMHWGHAVSDDLVHWRHLPIALAPTPGGPDESGVFSGCAVDHDGVPTIVYTGVRGKEQLVCLARAADPDDPDLVKWEKDPRNPVIAARPEGTDWLAYRDPSVWREGDEWYMVHGAGIVDVGGAALLYRSRDLVDWEYLGPISTGDVTRQEPVWTGSMWECPQLFPLGDRHVLIIAVWFQRPPLPSTHYTAYAIGDFDGRRFTPRTEAILDTGALYAPQTMRDDRGRRLLWGWIRETRTNEAQAAAGWSGAMTIPWVLTLGAGDTLNIAPAPELEALRGAHTRLTDIALADRAELLSGLAGDCLELDVEIDPGSAARVGLTLRHAPGDAEYTRLSFEPATGRLAIERERSSLDESADRTTRPTVLALAPGEPLRLRIFLDRSIVEVFANERVALTERIYPTRPDSLGLTAFAAGGRAALRRLDCWQMGTIW